MIGGIGGGVGALAVGLVAGDSLLPGRSVVASGILPSSCPTGSRTLVGRVGQRDLLRLSGPRKVGRVWCEGSGGADKGSGDGFSPR